MKVSDYQYQWAKGLARKIEDDIQNKLEELNDQNLNFEHLLIKDILEYTYSQAN